MDIKGALDQLVPMMSASHALAMALAFAWRSVRRNCRDSRGEFPGRCPWNCELQDHVKQFLCRTDCDSTLQAALAP